MYFIVLWNRPAHLYSPKDYGENIDVAQYVNSLQQTKSASEHLLNEMIQINETSSRLSMDVVRIREDIERSKDSSLAEFSEISQKISSLSDEVSARKVELESAVSIFNKQLEEANERIRKTKVYALMMR